MKFLKSIVASLMIWSLFITQLPAQQPQLTGAPNFAVNAQVTNGVAPGYAPLSNGGLVLNIGPGTSFCSGTIVQYAGGNITLTASNTNYVYLDTTLSCAPGHNTTGFSGTTIPIAVVVVGSSSFTNTNIADARTFFSTGVSAPAPAAFGSITSGTNNAAAMHVGTGASLDATGSGTINATAENGVACTGTPTTGQVCTATGSTTATWQTPAGGATSFNTITNGTNTNTLHVGTGGTLDTTGSGIINATAENGVSCTGTPTTGQACIATGSTTATWQTITTSGVQYNPVNTIYYIVADSIGGVSADSCFETALPSDTSPITAGSVTSGTASFTGTNTWGSGCVTILTGFTGGAAGLNGQLCVVSATGLSGSAFQCPVTGGNIASTGTGQAQARYNLTGRLTYDETFTAGHGTVINDSTSSQTIAQMTTAYATTAHLSSPAVTGHPGYLIIFNINQDFYNGRTDTQIEGDLLTYWATARVDNWTAIIMCGVVGLHTTNATQLAFWASVNRWLLAQGPTNASRSTGQYYDRYVPLDNVLPNGYDPLYFGQTGGAPGHLVDMGNLIAADYINMAFSAQGATLGMNPNGARNFGGQVLINNPSGGAGGVTGPIGVSDPTSGGSWTLQVYNDGFGIPMESVNGALMDSLHVLGGGAASRVIPSTAIMGWNNSSTAPSAWINGSDTSFSRLSAGIVAVGKGGASGDTNGSMEMGGVITAATKFTTSGCSISATTGGATGGTFTLGANTCTAVITMNGATGLTSPHGWSCQAHDQTAPTVLIGGESSSTTTTASFTIPAGAGATDVISFGCIGY
jgi:hypothetical protein